MSLADEINAAARAHAEREAAAFRRRHPELADRAVFAPIGLAMAELIEAAIEQGQVLTLEAAYEQVCAARSRAVLRRHLPDLLT
jgi:hypothetical protein